MKTNLTYSIATHKSVYQYSEGVTEHGQQGWVTLPNTPLIRLGRGIPNPQNVKSND